MSNLSAIGFDAESEEGLVGLMDKVLDRAVAPKELGAWAKRHAWFQDPSGAAIAVHVEDGKIACLTPFFAPEGGGSRWKVRTRGPHLDKQCADCSGADCDILDGDPPELVTRSAVQWLYFDAFADWLREERTYEVEVAGFATSLDLCATEEEWEAAQSAKFGGTRVPGEPIEPGKPMRLADEAFMPYGMFENEGDLGSRARALVTGHVERLEHPANQLTGNRFTWVRIRTLCGPLDLVSPFQSDTTFVPGMRALADAWLVGRPVNPPPQPRQSWWRKITRG